MIPAYQIDLPKTMPAQFKSLSYYLSLNYSYELVRDQETDGYFAVHPDLGGCIAQGETAEEAIENLDKARGLWLQYRIEHGLSIPEPPAPEFSGQLSIRMPVRTYSKLLMAASERGLSLGLLINMVLADFIATEINFNEKPPRAAGKRQRSKRKDRIFISYSHKDKQWLQKIQTMLKPAARRGIVLWDDTRIAPGSKWRQEIAAALKSAVVAVLLVSPHFLSSDFIAEDELPPLLEAAERGGVRILWVSVSSCLYEETEISKYQAANDPSVPLDSLNESEQNRQLVQICQKILSAFRES